MTAPLEGVTVVSVEQAVAAPFATRQLAELGARVIKVERPGTGDFARGYDEMVGGESTYFVWLNRTKESIAIDLKAASARDVMRRLCERADVIVENLGPGASGRLGLDAATLRARDPGLVVCTISGYGPGPWSDRKAYDMLVQAETGLVSITGSPDAPARVGISIADIAAGMYAYSSILAALVRRGRTGEGATIDVSLFDALSEWMGAPMYAASCGGREPPRRGVEHASIAPYARYATADGAGVLIAVQNEREWASLCEVVLGDGALAADPRFATNSARVEHRDAVHAIVGSALVALTAEEACELLGRAGVAYARVRTVSEAVRHEARSPDHWTEVASPSGPVRALLPPARLDHAAVDLGPIPAIGEHSRAVLAWLGYADEDIARFARDGVVALGSPD